MEAGGVAERIIKTVHLFSSKAAAIGHHDAVLSCSLVRIRRHMLCCQSLSRTVLFAMKTLRVIV